MFRLIFFAGILAFLVVASYSAWIADFDRPNLKELSRVGNGDSSIDAVLAERETGATVATPTEVYLVPHGGPLEGDAVFRADHNGSIKLVWKGNQALTISAEKARIFLRSSSTHVTTQNLSLNVTINLEIRHEIP